MLAGDLIGLYRRLTRRSILLVYLQKCGNLGALNEVKLCHNPVLDITEVIRGLCGAETTRHSFQSWSAAVETERCGRDRQKLVDMRP